VKRWIPAVALLVAGMGIGSCMAQNSTKAPPPIVKTKYVDRPVEKKVTVTKVLIPDSCAEALDLAVQIKTDASQLVGVATTAQDILIAGHVALTSKDGKGMNTQRDKLYALESRNNDASQDIELKTVPALDEALRKCKATKAYKEK
jgi:hypothetical protein